jgi:hypothetical protein
VRRLARAWNELGLSRGTRASYNYRFDTQKGDSRIFLSDARAQRYR